MTNQKCGAKNPDKPEFLCDRPKGHTENEDGKVRPHSTQVAIGTRWEWSDGPRIANAKRKSGENTIFVENGYEAQ